MAHGSHGMFTQAGYNDPSQDESSQMHYGMGAPGHLQSQVVHLFPCVQCFFDRKTVTSGANVMICCRA
jgi:hypothetical protein